AVRREDRVAVLEGRRRQLAVRAARDFPDPDVARYRGAVVLAPRVLVALAVFVRDELAVLAEPRELRRRREELLRAAARRRDLVELREERRRQHRLRRVEARAREDDELPVRREAGRRVRRRVERQARRRAALRGDGVDIEVAESVG